MNVKIYPSKLSGEISAIASKSYAQRALLAASLSDMPVDIHMKGNSKDVKACMSAIGAMGAAAQHIEGGVRVTPHSIPEVLDVYAEESGTTARLILPIMAAKSKSGTLSASGTLLKRPFVDLCECMSEHGVRFTSYDLPISYESNMRGGEYKIAADKSSQYISGLMFALPLLENDSKIILTTDLQSSGYLDITREVLAGFKVSTGYNIKGKQRYKSPGVYNVEGDWSNASYWLSVGIIPSGLNEKSLQKDRLFTEVCENSEIDMSEIPDLVSALSVYATQKGSATTLYNIERLRIKESDRVESVCDMISALGGRIERDEEKMVIYPSKLTGGIVKSHNDHRIVMAAAVASHFCSSDIIIEGAEAVMKSYGDFFKDFKRLGGKYDVI